MKVGVRCFWRTGLWLGVAGFSGREGDGLLRTLTAVDGHRQRLACEVSFEQRHGIVQEPAPILLASANYAFDRGESIGAPIGAVGSTIATCGGDAADVAFAEAVVAGHLGKVQECE